MRFKDLKGLGGGYLSYDFAYFEEGVLVYLIECQGMQHFSPVDYFGGEKKFESQLEHDRLKRQYAKEHNIQLIELDYNLIHQHAGCCKTAERFFGRQRFTIGVGFGVAKSRHCTRKHLHITLLLVLS
jgi:hypothetical protein